MWRKEESEILTAWRKGRKVVGYDKHHRHRALLLLSNLVVTIRKVLSFSNCIGLVLVCTLVMVMMTRQEYNDDDCVMWYGLV